MLSHVTQTAVIPITRGIMSFWFIEYMRFTSLSLFIGGNTWSAFLFLQGSVTRLHLTHPLFVIFQ